MADKGTITFASRDHVPKGAILLTKDQALQHQWEMIRKWKPRRDVFPLTAGSGISASVAAVGSMAFHSLFRKHYRLQNFARASTYLPIVFLPMVGAFLSHQVVASDIILLSTHCTACVQAKGTALQLFFGFFYPMLISPAICIPFALRCNTYALPPLRTHYRAVILDAMTAFKRRSTRVTAVFGLQVLATFFLLHTQMQSIFKLHSRQFQSE